MVQIDKKSCVLLSISQETYIIWFSFVVHKCEMMKYRVFLFFFKILIFRVVNGVKGQKMAQNNKKLCMLLSTSQEPYIIWSSFVVHNCNLISSSVFFIFFKIVISWIVSKVKEYKMAQNDKKLCLAHSISQEPYIIWFSFLIHLCKMMVRPGIFSFFKIMIFRAVRGVKEQKMVQNDKKSFYIGIHLMQG